MAAVSSSPPIIEPTASDRDLERGPRRRPSRLGLERSALLPDLDFALIAELSSEPKQIDAVRALRARLTG